MSRFKNRIIIVALVCAVVIGQMWYMKERLSRIFYLTSLIVAVGALLMYYLSFEERKPKTRELVLVCVLSSIAVCSRMIFFFAPQIKPVAAIVILCGVYLGKETGFLVGSITMLLSNFFFGQGPFTPLAMVAMGLIGYGAGLLFNEKTPSVYSLCIYGFVSVYIIYGGIMNFSTLTLFTDYITLSAIITAFATAFIFDIIHSVSTVIFIVFLAKGFGERLTRVKKIYGIAK